MVLEKVRSTIESHRMLRPGDKVLAGVSGGPDSLALLAALVALREPLKFTLRAAYVDHGLRPAAARREAKRVQEAGKRWNVPVLVLKASLRREKGESVESAARRVRYNLLGSAAKKWGANKIALGHTADDQAETVLMWLLRGSGMAGLSGIPPVRPMNGKPSPRIIRPLIGLTRAEGKELLKSHGIRPLTDESNASTKFLRNRIRHELLPLLERHYNPAIRRSLVQLSDLLREDLSWLDGMAKEAFSEGARSGKDNVRLDLRYLVAAPSGLRRALLRLAVERLQGDCHGFSAAHWLGLEKSALSGVCRGVDLPRRFRAEIVDGRWLALRRKKDDLKG
jgi:tRNA(Ile)-lysidine synthase